MKGISLKMALVVLALVVGGAGAAVQRVDGLMARDTLGSQKTALFWGSAVFRGSIGTWATNTSASDTIEQGEVVFYVTDAVTVVAPVQVGAATDTLTIADTLWNGHLDTLASREYGAAGPAYDTAGIALWNVRVWMDKAGATATDTNTVTVVGYGYDGGSRSVTLTFVGSTDRDTVLATQFSKVTAVYATGTNAADSFAVYAQNLTGVAVGTGGGLVSGAAYAGVAQEQILPRKRGYVARTGRAKVKLDASSSSAANGYYLSPSATAGYADAAASKPQVQIGWVVKYTQFDDLCDAWLHHDVSVSAADIDSLATYSMFNDTIVALRSEIADGDSTVEADLTGMLNDTTATLRQEVADGDSTAEADLLAVIADTTTALRGEIIDSWEYQIGAGMFALPSSNAPSFSQVAGTNFDYDALAFDQTSPESAYANLVIPHILTDGSVGLEASIWWVSAVSDTTVKVVWGLSTVVNGEHVEWDIPLASVALDTADNAGTGLLNIATITIPSLVLTGNSIPPLLIYRVADSGADDLAGDASLLRVRFRVER